MFGFMKSVSSTENLLGFLCMQSTIKSKGSFTVYVSGFLMQITLLCTVSKNGNLIFSIDGDLPKKSYRGEGNLRLILFQTNALLRVMKSISHRDIIFQGDVGF